MKDSDCAAWTEGYQCAGTQFKLHCRQLAPRSQMLCCLYIHSSRIHTSAAGILAVCVSRSAQSTLTHCKVDCKPWQQFLASAAPCTTMRSTKALTMD